MDLEVDRISNLPDLPVDKILSLLTIRDAVRTCILSSKWRYKWMNLTSLVFDDQSVIISSWDSTILTNKFVKIVDHVLLLHNGLIHKLKLSTRFISLCTYDIDRWIFFLSRSRVSVKEFILDTGHGHRYKLPSSLYLCNKLSHLELYNCTLLKPPLTFNGFKILTSLHLRRITIGQDAFENLIYSCPLLERLILNNFEGCSQLKINAPKLTFVGIQGEFQDVIFENTFYLSTVSIAFVNFVNVHASTRTTSTLIKFFSSLPSIQRLELRCSFLRFLAVDMVPMRLLTPCLELKYLSLSIDFEDMRECLAVLCILQSSPNLLELEMLNTGFLGGRAAATNLLNEDYRNCLFKQLNFVKIADVFGGPRELEFIKFLLATSPILETMTIKSATSNTSSVLFKKLLRFRRASAKAEIIYLDRCG